MKATRGWPSHLMPTHSSPFASPTTAALNRLLESQPWARARLAPFAGRTVLVKASPMPPLTLGIGPDGLLERREEPAAPDVTVRIGPAALLAWTAAAGQPPPGIAVEGDPALGDAILELMGYLRWDGEEALSRLIGDAPAHRVGDAMRGLAAWQADAFRRLAGSATAWAAEEKNLLVTRTEFDEFRRSVEALRAAIERLGKRLP